MLKAHQHILDIVGLSQAQVWRTYLNLFNSHCYSFMKNKPEDNKGISKHSRFRWQQLFGPLHNITISLKSIRPNKTEIKIIAEKENWYISPSGRLEPLACTTLWPPNPLSYRHCWETNFTILLIIAGRYCRRNARFLTHSSTHRKFQQCAARVLIRPDQSEGARS